MKIVTWTRDNVPDDLDIDDNGDYVFEDHPLWFNLEVGDQIQFVSFPQSLGTRCFFVVDVCPIDEESTLRKMVVIE